MKIIEGDLLNCKEVYIVQQCNCLTVYPHGLSKSIADKFPWADPYSSRTKVPGRNLAVQEDRPQPGTIKILTSPKNISEIPKNVICMFAQWGPGTPLKFTSYPDYKIDTRENREKWFQECLDKIAGIKDSGIKELAFPYKIGCGLAGGNWSRYRNMIMKFEKETGVLCTLYKLQ